MVDKIVIKTQFYYYGRTSIPRSDITAALALLADDKKNEELVNKLMTKVKKGILQELRNIKEQLKRNE